MVKFASMKRHLATFSQQLCSAARNKIQIQCYGEFPLWHSVNELTSIHEDVCLFSGSGIWCCCELWYRSQTHQIQCYIHQTVQSDSVRGWRKGEVGTFNFIIKQELFWYWGEIFSQWKKKFLVISLSSNCNCLLFYLEEHQTGFQKTWALLITGPMLWQVTSLLACFLIWNIRKLTIPTSAVSFARSEAPRPGSLEFVGFDLTALHSRESLSGEKSSPSVWGCGKGDKRLGLWPADSCAGLTGLPSNPKHPHFPEQFSPKQWAHPEFTQQCQANTAEQSPELEWTAWSWSWKT